MQFNEQNYSPQDIEQVDFRSFKNELNFLKNEINIKTTNEKKETADISNSIVSKGINKFGKNEDIGVYFRIMRYQKDIQKYANKYNIPYKYLFALTGVESKGNEISININDGGAGIIHFQPDVAKQYGLRVFTDKEPYKKYAVGTLKNQINKETGEKWKKSEIYVIHAKILRGIIQGKGVNSLAQIDDRFNREKCLDAACKYLIYMKKNYINKNYKKETSHSSRDKYKKNIEEFKRKLTLNAFNKGPSNFTKNYESGSHISNIDKQIKYKEYYEQRIKYLIKRGLSDDEIIENLKYPFTKVNIKEAEKGREYFRYEGKITNKDNIATNFDNRDSEYNNNYYKNTGRNNIIKINNLLYIKAKTKIIGENDRTIKIETQNKTSFEYIRNTTDNKYKVYSYTIRSGGTAYDVLNKFQQNGGQKDKCIVTDSKGNKYTNNHYFNKGTKIYIKESI